MHWHVMLDRGLLHRLHERTLGSQFWFTEVHPEAVTNLSSESRTFIVDPTLNDGAYALCSALLARQASWNLLAYTRLSAESTRRLVALARVGFFRMVLYDHNDSAQNFWRTLEEEELQSISKRVLVLLNPRMEKLAEPLRLVVADLFRCPRRYHAAGDLAFAAGLSPESMYRGFKAAGLCSPKRLIAAARVARVASYGVCGRRSSAAAGNSAGYGDPRILRGELRRTLGCGFQSLRSWSESDVIEALAGFAIAPYTAGSTERPEILSADDVVPARRVRFGFMRDVHERST
jgi:hypothetical protein